MTSRERPASALDTGHGDDASEADPLALAEAAEAEAAAAEAEARAAAARARAIRLRREADAAPAEHSDEQDDPTDVAESDDALSTSDTATTTTAQSPRPRRLIWTAVTVVAGILLICAALAGSGYMVWQDRVASQQRQRAAEFAAAARQGVTALMSLDFKKTNEDLQRIADNSTGNFRNSFPAVADKLTKGLEQSKVTTTVTVNDVAVESMTDNSAIVLVAATTEAKAPDGPPQPRSWHLALGLRRDGGKPKMANIEFVQ
jgi:Mce-associated membrane protein